MPSKRLAGNAALLVWLTAAGTLASTALRGVHPTLAGSLRGQVGLFSLPRYAITWSGHVQA